MSAKNSRKRRFWSSFGGGNGQGSKSTARRRKSAGERRWIKLALGGGAAICGLGAIAGAALWVVQSGAGARFVETVETELMNATREAGLAVEAVYVAGRKQADRDALIEAIGVDVGDPILTVDAEAVRARIEALGWVAHARVQRRLPDRLLVRIAERRAAAIWQRDGQFVLIDRGGHVIGPEDVDSHRHLKVLVGDDAPQHAAGLLAVLDQEPALKARIVAAVWIGERRWNLRLDNGIDVRLPESDPVDAWRRLARLERDHDILARAIKAIDLRQSDRLIVRMTRDGAMSIRARNEGEET